MSPSGRLCLLTIVGLILPTRGQTLKDTTSSSSANSTIMDIQVPTPAPDAVYTELQPTPPTPTWPADGAYITAYGVTHFLMNMLAVSSFFCLHTAPQ
ncbi:LOW QUALITY PROTEIN: FXYD5 isoform 2 [Pongo abelii]|uniref:FXYD5 isoform 2 n=1 Tax=Pongo abelii TaxID=9601 RepID=A0A2J8RR92_PONAB|nr:LOW QUALITY PROTEIN: FXYD5 isoform 2 [Pongo abelii]